MVGEMKGSMRTLATILTIFGGFQVFLILQFNYVNLRQMPNQCDCQCTKQLHFGGTNRRQDEHDNSKVQTNKIIEKGPKASRKQEEKHRNQILEADDIALDKEIEANQTKRKQETVEDPEEGSPYEQEKLEDSEIQNEDGTLVLKPLHVNPQINASSLYCGDNSTNLLLFYVYSAPGNFKQRQRVRQTYGAISKIGKIELRFIFFIGRLSEEVKGRHYKHLLNESHIYGDLVQDRSYIDAYRNLTLKGISALRWIAQYCPNTYRVMKIDDDTMVNPYMLVRFLSGQSSTTMTEVICKVTQGVGPIRNPKSKYYVSRDEYKKDYYPPYCQGYGYIFPPKILPKLIKVVDRNPIIAMEDVFITGITLKEIDVRLHSLTALYATIFGKFDRFLDRITNRPDLLIVGHVHDQRHVDLYWQLILEREDSRKKEEEYKKNHK